MADKKKRDVITGALDYDKRFGDFLDHRGKSETSTKSLDNPRNSPTKHYAGAVRAVVETDMATKAAQRRRKVNR